MRRCLSLWHLWRVLFLLCIILVQSVVSNSLWPHGLHAARQASLSITTSWSLLKLMSIESVMPSNHLILCHPLFFLPSIFPSIRSFPVSQFFTSSGQSIGVSASVLPMNIQVWVLLGWTGWISLQSKGLLSLLQHHSSKASILQCSAFFTVQLSHLYMTTGKTVALTKQIFVGKVMSLLFIMLSRLIIAFLPRSKCLLISWLQSPSAEILEPKIVVCHCFHCFPIYLPWSDWTGCWVHYIVIPFFLNIPCQNWVTKCCPHSRRGK